MISAISVKDRLKNQAKEDGRTLQDELVTYGLEREQFTGYLFQSTQNGLH